MFRNNILKLTLPADSPPVPLPQVHGVKITNFKLLLSRLLKASKTVKESFMIGLCNLFEGIVISCKFQCLFYSCFPPELYYIDILMSRRELVEALESRTNSGKIESRSLSQCPRAFLCLLLIHSSTDVLIYIQS